MTKSAYQHLQATKKKALVVLAPLGFVDNNDDEFPETIYHPDLGVSINTAQIGVGQIVAEVLKVGIARGAEAKRREILDVMGIP